MGDLVIVSNRGPFSFTSEFLNQVEHRLENGKWPSPPRFGEGGLGQAMSGLLRPGAWRTTWLGSSMGDRDVDVARGHYSHLFQGMEEKGLAPQWFPHIEIDPDNRMHFRYGEYDFFMRFVFFDTPHMHSYYSRFANGFLWPLIHLTRPPLFYKKSSAFPRPEFQKSDFVQYTSSGLTFANTVLDEIQKSGALMRTNEETVVWNQDYHLMRVSEDFKGLLRQEGIQSEAGKHIHVGQFMHTPFFNIHEIQGLIREDKRGRIKARVYDPFDESIESVLKRVTWGLLHNDFIGFHTKEYCDNYLEALEEWFPVDIRVADQAYEIHRRGGVTTVGAFPIGLDVDKILAEVAPGKSLDYEVEERNLRKWIQEKRGRGKVVFGGLERRDFTKGLIERLKVYFHARNRLRESDRPACFFQITSPSRMSNPEYRRLQADLDQEVDKINGRLPEDEGIVHLGGGIPAPENYRFMKEVDVMLVTPLEDGMNLVAFEYILSQKYKSREMRGILVLSTSGAARVLRMKKFGEEDGVVFVNPMKPKEAGGKIADALDRGCRLSDRLIEYVETERRVDDWAERNIEAILNARKEV
ncbi:MAG: trehalose-6-phosphate synthase [Deltaproteobacteria bacterium]|nr:trehalose-6-phosphate synthase [Deltaproteobacteria bacterium]